MSFDMLVEACNWSYPGTSFVPVATTTATGTNDVLGYDQSHGSTNISNDISNTTTDAEPVKKLEK